VKGLLLRVAGTAVGVLLGFATGVWEVFLSPLYAGRVPLPVAPVLAIVTNLALVWFTYFVTGRKGLALLPGVAWFAVMLVGANPTAEGDVPIPGTDWMGLLALLLGVLAWAVAAYRLILVPGADRLIGAAAGLDKSARSGADKPALAVPDKPAAVGPDKPAAPRVPRPGARPARTGSRSARRRSGGNRGRAPGS
jgi:hypothetical protein